MRAKSSWLLGLALLLGGTVYSFERTASEAEGLSNAAAQLLASLDDSQRKQMRFDFSANERMNWHFVPLKSRKGVPLKEMSESQRELARQMLRAATSQEGFRTADRIMHLEKLLQVLEGDDRNWPRDWLLYYVTLFGDPQESGRWGLSFEGHHLSLNFVVENGKIISSTPQFFGANPATIRTAGAGFEKGTQVLGAEERAGFQLLEILKGDAREAAVLTTDPPKEIRGAGEAQPPTDPPSGLAAAKMSAEQKSLLRHLIELYTEPMPEAVTQRRWAAIEQAGFDKVHFAWLGADKPGIGHGYRVQGPTFVIELVNSQPDAEGNPANHIHSVWRDMKGDFANPIAKK